MEENKALNEGQGQEIETTETENERKYSQQEVDDMIQRISDRRVTEALKKQEKKNAEKLKEAQKLATMSETQKYEYELQKREAAIAEKERELALAENKAEASKILAEKGLSPQLVDFVVSELAEDMMANINLLDKAFKESVKAEVNKRLAGNAPKKGLPLEKTITKEDFLKMSYAELMDLKQNNPEIFDSFKN